MKINVFKKENYFAETSPSTDQRPISSPLLKLIKKQFQRRFSSNDHLLAPCWLVVCQLVFPGCFIIKKKYILTKKILCSDFLFSGAKALTKRKIVEAKTFLIKFGNMKNLL